MKVKKAFTLIELIVVLVILAIIALIAIPIVVNIINKSEDSARKRSVDGYGHSIELAYSTYTLDTGHSPKTLEDLNIKYNGPKVECGEYKLNSDGSVFLTKCRVNSVIVKDKETSDGYYHYGDKNEKYIYTYGRYLEKTIKNYKTQYGSLPSDLNSISTPFDSYFGCDVKIYNNNELFLSKCKFKEEYLKDNNTLDGYKHYGTYKSQRTYSIGSYINYNGVGYYVIKNSKVDDYSVTLLKAEPLSVNEVNQYGSGYINRYTSSYRESPYNMNGYGGIAYHSSETCGYINNSDCNVDFKSSNINSIINNWANNVFRSGDLVVDDLGYKVRLLSLDDLTINLGYNKVIAVCGYLMGTKDVPSWVYNSNYSYWTMSNRNDSEYVWYVSSYYGNVDSDSISNRYYAIRPVITIRKDLLN